MALLQYLLLVGGHYIQLRVWLHSILEDVDIHSHVLKHTQRCGGTLLMAWLLTSPTTLAYPLTHSTPHGATQHYNTQYY